MLNKTDGKAIFIHISSMENMSDTMMRNIAVCLENIEYFR